MAKQYELTYTINKNLALEEANPLFERVISYFPQATTSGKEHDFFSLEFYSEPKTIQDLEKKIQSESQIKKHVIIKKEKVKIMRMRTKTKNKPEPVSSQEEKKAEKAELKEIDEKLKQIFGE